MDKKSKRHFYGLGKNKRRVYESKNWKDYRNIFVNIDKIIFPLNEFSLKELKSQYVRDAYKVESKSKLDNIELVKVRIEHNLKNSLISLVQERFYAKKKQDNLRIIASYLEKYESIPCKIVETNEKYQSKVYTIDDIKKKIGPIDRENFSVYVYLDKNIDGFFSADSLATGQI
ncbi:MAG: hypothetical protein PHV16_03315 [Candidatus Nanoarchaeia archaeon]|nr:hypothetical protein [Candidatus Nanoarchaeia archaeon]